MNSSEPRAGSTGSGQSIRRIMWPSGAAQRVSAAPGGMARRSKALVKWIIPPSRPWLLFGKSCALARSPGIGVPMLDDPFKYGLLAALAIALLVAAFTDFRSRRIGNWLNGGIALAAPLFWWASGLSLWPDIALQLGVALATLTVLAGLFALRAMGGGDVKL